MLTFPIWTFGLCVELRLSWTSRLVGIRRGLSSERLGSPFRGKLRTWKWRGELVCPWRVHWYGGRSPAAFYLFLHFHPIKILFFTFLTCILVFHFLFFLLPPSSFSIYLSICLSLVRGIGFPFFSFLFLFSFPSSVTLARRRRRGPPGLDGRGFFPLPIYSPDEVML